MTKSHLIAFAALCLTSFPALAQGDETEGIWTQEQGRKAFTAQYASEGAEKTLAASEFLANCLGPTGYAGMSICMSENLKLWDEKLNLEYTQAMKVAKAYDRTTGSDERKAEALLQHQRIRITYRDAACTDKSYAYLGGSGERQTYIACKQDMTAKRTVELWIRNVEGSRR